MNAEQPYSLLFSLVAEIGEGLTFKLLLKKRASSDEYEAAVTAFLDLLDAIHSGEIDEGTFERLANGRIVGRTLLLAYDEQAKRLTPIDPLAKRRG